MFKYKSALVLFILVFAFLVFPKPAHAFSFNDIIDNIKGLFSSQNEKQQQDQDPSLSITSKISLAPDGDYNHNGHITSGDIVRYSYTILNTTESSYRNTSLKTNIDSKFLNGISNVQGATSLDSSNGTITIPNINIDKHQIRKISFDAQINFNKNSDETLSTQPELINQEQKTLVTDSKQSERAKRMDEATFNKFVHIVH